MRSASGLAVIAAVLAFAAGGMTRSAQAADHPSASQLEGELVCVTCKETLDESDSPIARRMKAYIRQRIAQGATGTQIKNELVAEFGEEVLATPRTHGFDLLAWLLPIGGIGVGAVGLGALAWVWSRRRAGGAEEDGEAPHADAAPLGPELERRVDEALSRFED